MAHRLDLHPLIKDLAASISNRREDLANERPDRGTQIVLLAVPGLVGILVVAFRIELRDAGQLLAGAALLAGALLTGFGQVAAWRERLLLRPISISASRVRSLNEAAGHILVGLVISLVASLCVMLLSNLSTHSGPIWVHGLAVGLSAAAAACISYIAISLVIVVNLLWDAYKEDQDEVRHDALPEYGDDSTLS